MTNQENHGFAGGCNDGAAVARHDILVFLNNDTVLSGRWLDPLIVPFDEDATVGRHRAPVELRLRTAGGRGGLLPAGGRAGHAPIRPHLGPGAPGPDDGDRAPGRVLPGRAP